MPHVQRLSRADHRDADRQPCDESHSARRRGLRTRSHCLERVEGKVLVVDALVPLAQLATQLGDSRHRAPSIDQCGLSGAREDVGACTIEQAADDFLAVAPFMPGQRV